MRSVQALLASAGVALLGCAESTTLVADDHAAVEDAAGPIADAAGIDSAGVDARVQAVDARAPDATTADAITADDAGSASHGAVVSLDDQGAGRVALVGGFFEAPITDVRRGLFNASCTILLEAVPCRVVSCASPLSSTDAGLLAAAVDGAPLTSATLAGGAYAGWVDRTLLSGGERVTLSATGALVPAFSVDVVAPALPAVTLPTTIFFRTELVITWGPTTAESVQVVLSAGLAPDTVCTVPGADRSVTIPAAFVGRYSSGVYGRLSFTAFDTTTILVGDYAIDGRAATHVGVGPLIAPQR